MAGGAGRALSAEPDGAHVLIDLAWQGKAADFAERDAWLDAPLAEGLGALSPRDVLTHHRTALWPETRAGQTHLRLPLPPAVEDHENAPAETLPERPEFYDFALLRRRVSEDIRETPLAETSFTVFDTETTGLFPSAGDEIVQIAGVRMIGARVLRGERFDRLVDPGRRIPAASTRIHGITDAMVEGQGDVRAVLPEFHAFASGSVLVAHNAPFDMTFLRSRRRRRACASTSRCSTRCCCRPGCSGRARSTRWTRWPHVSVSPCRRICATPPWRMPWPPPMCSPG